MHLVYFEIAVLQIALSDAVETRGCPYFIGHAIAGDRDTPTE